MWKVQCLLNRHEPIGDRADFPVLVPGLNREHLNYRSRTCESWMSMAFEVDWVHATRDKVRSGLSDRATTFRAQELHLSGRGLAMSWHTFQVLEP